MKRKRWRRMRGRKRGRIEWKTSVRIERRMRRKRGRMKRKRIVKRERNTRKRGGKTGFGEEGYRSNGRDRVGR